MVRLRNKSGLVLGLSAVLCLPLAAQTNAPKTPTPTTADTAPKTIATATAAVAPKTPTAVATAPPKTTVKTKAATPQKRHPHSKKPAPLAEVPQPPPPPSTLEQMPPTAPEVSYHGGQLAINSQNSTLSQVLRSVQAQTGASVEMPASASNERVVAQLGPGQPRDVINALLNGSKFDYVILGVAGSPGAVQKVILTMPKAASSAVTAASGNGPSAPAHATEEEQQDEANYTEPEVVPEPAAQPMSPNFRRPPMTPPGRMGEINQQSPDNGDQQNGVKTPEQLLQEMQQMQQQQQQMQEQLNPANRGPQ